jgi:pathogenesis-related protein 1
MKGTAVLILLFLGGMSAILLSIGILIFGIMMTAYAPPQTPTPTVATTPTVAMPPTIPTPTALPTTSTTPVAPPPPQTPPPQNPAGSLERDAIERHNMYRSQHGVPPLQWDPEMAKVAQKLVDTNAEHCPFDHKLCHSGEPGTIPRHGYGGENLSGGGDVSNAVDLWAVERTCIPDVLSKEHEGFGCAGHFTQVVWRDVKRVGCGATDKAGGQVACIYDVYGAGGLPFREGVPPLVGRDRETWSDGKPCVTFNVAPLAPHCKQKGQV